MSKSFGCRSEQQVAHAAADEERLETGAPQPVEHLEAFGEMFGPADVVVGARDDDGTGRRFEIRVVQQSYRGVHLLERPVSYQPSPRRGTRAPFV